MTEFRTDHYEDMNERSFYDELMELRDSQRNSDAVAWPVVEGDAIPWELNPIGMTRWYMAPTMTDLPMNAYTVYLVKIAAGGHTGTLRMPGDEVGFVWRGGNGHSLISGDEWPWKQGDAIQIPSRPEGCVVQHFNDDEVDAEIVFCRVNTATSIGVDRGVELVQIDSCPEYDQKSRG